ncbi:PepSY domain-containing protein [Pontixanthobacter aestiaquae]|uniref:PepSY-associated TM region n=1 Tax=Pontixanthobacter aestiaquae TaxID=1509367 RepID=A0A844Z5K2_9SPHN|nr:PepSY domain-containing protein [Pontixanthobacter aestiaquae]MDN3645059.1 PepSY domain-containing protein [Pontixanthobacter aestiaquae]MXO83941.1 hypothetical protein [Pontixanthobacter aestiaquae]
MAKPLWMVRFAKWHIWLGWLVAVPLLMWTISGLLMVSRPIEEVRGNHLRQPVEEQALPPDTNIAIALPEHSTQPVQSVATVMQNGAPITTITYMDGAIERFGGDGAKLPKTGEVAARAIVADRIVGGDKVVSSTFFEQDDVPNDFRRPMDVWQVVLKDGTHVYVSHDTGEIAAVRTRFWRVFDFMWGLHIMDLETRSKTHHPILIFFAALAAITVIFGSILMFRRRKKRVRVNAS